MLSLTIRNPLLVFSNGLWACTATVKAIFIAFHLFILTRKIKYSLSIYSKCCTQYGFLSYQVPTWWVWLSACICVRDETLCSAVNVTARLVMAHSQTDRGGGDTQQEGQSDIATGQAGQLELWENTNMHMKSTHNIQAMLFERLAHIPTPQLDIMANILAHAFASSCTRRHCQIIKVSAEPRPLIGDKKDVPITCFSK